MAHSRTIQETTRHNLDMIIQLPWVKIKTINMINIRFKIPNKTEMLDPLPVQEPLLPSNILETHQEESRQSHSEQAKIKEMIFIDKFRDTDIRFQQTIYFGN